MIKPANWNNIEAKKFEGFPTLPPGAHICKITSAQWTKSKSGNDMLMLECDIAQGDFKGFYEKSQYPPKAYITLGETESSIANFKANIQDIEKCNEGYRFDFANPEVLCGKLFVGVFGEEEYLNKNGDIKTNLKLQEIRNYDDWNNGIKTPEKKLYVPNQTGGYSPSVYSPINQMLDGTSASGQFVSAPTDGDLPF